MASEAVAAAAAAAGTNGGPLRSMALSRASLKPLVMAAGRQCGL